MQGDIRLARLNTALTLPPETEACVSQQVEKHVATSTITHSFSPSPTYMSVTSLGCDAVTGHV